MVTNSRAQKGTNPIRFLNVPVPIQIQSDELGRLAKILLASRWFKVVGTLDYWRIDDEWWRERPISRIYRVCVLEDGRRVMTMQDLNDGRWYFQQGE